MADLGDLAAGDGFLVSCGTVHVRNLDTLMVLPTHAGATLIGRLVLAPGRITGEALGVHDVSGSGGEPASLSVTSSSTALRQACFAGSYPI